MKPIALLMLCLLAASTFADIVKVGFSDQATNCDDDYTAIDTVDALSGKIALVYFKTPVAYDVTIDSFVIQDLRNVGFGNTTLRGVITVGTDEGDAIVDYANTQTVANGSDLRVAFTDGWQGATLTANTGHRIGFINSGYHCRAYSDTTGDLGFDPFYYATQDINSTDTLDNGLNNAFHGAFAWCVYLTEAGAAPQVRDRRTRIIRGGDN